MPSVVAPVRVAPGPGSVDLSAMKAVDESKLTFEEKFARTNWQNKDDMVKLFPDYVQEQHNLRKNRAKNVSNTVYIEPFCMKTPYGDRYLLQDTQLSLEPGKRQGLIGANSTGKTLLFSNIIQGKIKDFPKHLHVHHCKELESEEDMAKTVLGCVTTSYPYMNVLKKCEAKLKDLLAADPAPSADAKEALQNNLDYVQQQLNTLKSADAKERAEKMLRVLGFDENGQNRLVKDLSGGLRMRVALCMAFFIEADLLLLDEPTNHLDFPSVLWLENRLRGYKGAFLLVSHDRELLNNVCTAVQLIEDKKIKIFNMSFKEFEKKKEQEDKKKYDDIEKFLLKNRNVDPSTPLGREKHDKKEWSDKYHAKIVAMMSKFTFPVAAPLSIPADMDPATPPEQVPIIKMTNLRFSYNPAQGHFIFNDPISFTVAQNTRVGVMGPNGAGKSTFLKLLTYKLTATEGSVVQHPKFNLAYFGQHSTKELTLEMTPAEWMQTQFPNEKIGNLRSHLAKTGVIGHIADTRMEGLSYSQRSCVIFSKLTFEGPHLLILDEPTNFLDLESVDSLIGACNKYKGALLLVSHNRDFLKKCANQYLSIVPGQFKLFDNLKDAEKSTYTFIAEMEEGGVKVGKDVLMNNPGGGSVHSSQKVGAAAEEKKEPAVPAKPLVAPAAPVAAAAAAVAPKAAPAAAAPAAKPAFAVGDKIQALWSDGKWYAAQVKKVTEDGKFTVLYTQYGNTVTVPASSVRAVPAGAAAGSKQQNGHGKQHHGNGKAKH